MKLAPVLMRKVFKNRPFKYINNQWVLASHWQWAHHIAWHRMRGLQLHIKKQSI
jgi:hypothetical protein